MMEGVRKRRVHGSAVSSQRVDAQATAVAGKEDDNVTDYNITELRGSFWLTRIVFIRSLGFVYCKRL